METVDLATAVELAEKIKNAYRATWDETRFKNEVTGEVSPTQYDVTLSMKGGGDLYFSYRETETGHRKWMQRVLDDPDADVSWEERHNRVERWLVLPEMLATLLWDVVTVHGTDAQKRGWSDISRGGPISEPTPAEVAKSMSNADVAKTLMGDSEDKVYARQNMGAGWTMHG